MCWSETASVSMVGLGAVATVIAVRRGEPKAIWVTLGYFTFMEALQAAGYGVIDECGSPVNKSVTLLSYLHIAFQPIFINAFGMAIMGGVSATVRRRVYALSALATLFVLARLIPFGWAGQCPAGAVLCGTQLCTISGEWHLGWTVPLNDMWGVFGPTFTTLVPFPAYILAGFVVPLFYGAWRFAIFHALFGPLLAAILTGNSNEMPAIWCLFSIGIILVSLSPAIRRHVGRPPAAPA